jgi:hypothetical protein
MGSFLEWLQTKNTLREFCFSGLLKRLGTLLFSGGVLAFLLLNPLNWLVRRAVVVTSSGNVVVSPWFGYVFTGLVKKILDGAPPT